MNAEKSSKKVLKNRLADAFLNSLSNLDLPEPSKKIRKVIARQAKEVAEIYLDILKKEEKKQKKAEKVMKKALSSQNRKRKKRGDKEVKVDVVKA